MEELKKKVILLRNFKSYMMADALERKDRHIPRREWPAASCVVEEHLHLLSVSCRRLIGRCFSWDFQPDSWEQGAATQT